MLLQLFEISLVFKQKFDRYGKYDKAIVAAPDESTAKHIHPNARIWNQNGKWMSVPPYGPPIPQESIMANEVWIPFDQCASQVVLRPLSVEESALFPNADKIGVIWSQYVEFPPQEEDDMLGNQFHSFPVYSFHSAQ